MVEIKKEINEKKSLECKVNNIVYKRYPVLTHKISIKENIDPIFESIKKEFKEGDFIVISEKFLTISEGRLIHKSLLKPSLFAKMLYRLIRFNMGEKAYKNDPAFAVPEKIQAAIFIAGWTRIILATLIGIPLTVLFKIFGKKKGFFYKIAGNRINEIDGTLTNEMPPFNEFIKIYPENPKLSCQKIEDKFSIPSCVVDANNISIEILGKSKKVKLQNSEIEKIISDNPMGQGQEKTPIILIRAT